MNVNPESRCEVCDHKWKFHNEQNRIRATDLELETNQCSDCEKCLDDAELTKLLKRGSLVGV